MGGLGVDPPTIELVELNAKDVVTSFIYSHTHSLCFSLIIFTSAKEVMSYTAFVCLSVC